MLPRPTSPPGTVYRDTLVHTRPDLEYMPRFSCAYSQQLAHATLAVLASRPTLGQGSLCCPKTDEDNADTDDTSRHPAAETHGLFEQYFRHNNDEDITQADRRIC